MSGFSTLAELDFNHSHLRFFSLLGEALRIKMAVGGAATEVTAAQFPDQVAAIFAMITADTAFAGVVVEIALCRAEVEGANGVGRQGAEAHGGDVKDRRGVGLAAIWTADRHAEAGGVRYLDRTHGVPDTFVAGLINVQLGTERLVAHFIFGASVNQRALGT
ncbi:hypothetical protein D3C71_1445120 [compost metagenome]